MDCIKMIDRSQMITINKYRTIYKYIEYVLCSSDFIIFTVLLKEKYINMRRKRSSWAGHGQRTDKMQIPRRLLTAKVEDRRRPAKPRKKGLQEVNKVTRSTGLDTGSQ
jgi:hypothetical protein